VTHHAPLIGQGSATEPLTEDAVRALLENAFQSAKVDGRRVLVIIPDGTRTAPVPLMFRLLYEVLGERVARLDEVRQRFIRNLAICKGFAALDSFFNDEVVVLQHRYLPVQVESVFS
jgi:hypothetical protein